MTGYDLSRFVNLTEDQKNEMLCSICLAILKSPVDTICGHTFCCDCINGWLNQYNESCPQCRHHLSPIFFNSKPYIDSTKRFRNLIEKLRIKCDFVDKGCEEVLELGLLRKHLQKCQFNECNHDLEFGFVFNFLIMFLTLFLVKNGPQLEWIPMKGNERPRPEAVIGGYDINGEPIYVGRALQRNDLIVGKIVPSHKCCYVSYNGQEIAHKDFEVLLILKLINY